MKKSMKWLAIVSILLAIVMCFSLVACGGDKDSDTDTNAGTDSDTDTGVPAGGFTVTFKQEGEADVVITVESGKTIDIPTPKAVAGYTVAWDQDLTGVAITQNVVVNAEKTPVENTINYNVNGGSNASSNPTKFTVEDAITFEPATRPGYEFKGWYSDAALTTPITGITKGTVTPVVNVYAKWEAASYSITYNTNNGTNPTTNPTSFNVESTGVIAGATKTGYEFLGWYLYSDFSGSVVDSLEDIASQGKAVTLYAKYRLERFTITYVNANGLSVTNNNVTDFNKEEAVTFVDPSRFGYTFDGWYSDDKFTTPITGIPAGTEGNQNVYAKWTATKYTITYKYDDDSKIVETAINPSEYSIETNVELLAPTVVDGYEFVGWFIEGTANQVTAILPGEYSGNIVLEGKIQVETFDIDYFLNGGTLPDGAPLTFTANDTGDNKITLPVLTRNGFTFNGWYTEATFENAITTIDGSIKKDVAVHAKWTATKYTITYNVGQEGVTNNNPVEFTAEQAIVFEALAKDGFTFVGWYTDAGYTAPITSTEGVYENLTLFAKWRTINTVDPTLQLKSEQIESTVANDTNERKDKIPNLYDGKATSGGIYDGGDGSWYGATGDTLTITLAEEMDIYKINLKGSGNWSYAMWTMYDASGKAVYSNNICLTAAYEVQDVVVFDSVKVNEEKDADGNVINTTTTVETIKVKTIVIVIGQQKWDTGTTNKFHEIEITVVNPDYVPTEE